MDGEPHVKVSSRRTRRPSGLMTRKDGGKPIASLRFMLYDDDDDRLLRARCYCSSLVTRAFVLWLFFGALAARATGAIGPSTKIPILAQLLGEQSFVSPSPDDERRTAKRSGSGYGSRDSAGGIGHAGVDALIEQDSVCGSLGRSSSE